MKNIFAGLKLFSWKSKTYGPITTMFSGRPKWTPRNYQNFARQGYMGNVYVYAAIREIAIACSQIPWTITKNDKEIDNHPALELLRNPNDLQSKASFVEGIISSYLISGNAYIEAFKGERVEAKPSDLIVLRPDRMQVIPGNNVNPIVGYLYTANGMKSAFKFQEVLHLKTYNPLDDFYGMSPIEAMSTSVDISNEGRAWNFSLLKNSGVPGGVLNVEGKLDSHERRQLRQEWIQTYGGAENAGTPMFLGGGLTWQDVGISPKDASWLEGQNLSAKEIAIGYGVPPEMIGDSQNKTYSNYQEARKAFYQETVIPTMNFLTGGLNRWYIPMYNEPGLVLSYDRDSIEAIQEERDKVWDRAEKGIRSAMITPNEGREMLGYDQSNAPGMNAFYLPAGLFPLGADGDDGSKKELEDKSLKTLNIEDKDAKVRYSKAFDRRRGGYIKVAKRIIDAQFAKETKEIVAVVKKSTKGNVVLNTAKKIDSLRKDWEKVLTAIYLTTGLDFAEFVDSNIQPTKSKELKQKDVWTESILKYVKEVSGDKITGILDTTKDKIKNILSKELLDRVEISEVAEQVEASSKAINNTRSNLIARTEVIAASNKGGQSAAVATGLKLEKEWLPVGDNFTRPDHFVSPRVPVDQPYIIGGEKLMFPGDSSLGASAANVIQCRCGEQYHVIE